MVAPAKNVLLSALWNKLPAAQLRRVQRLLRFSDSTNNAAKSNPSNTRNRSQKEHWENRIFHDDLAQKKYVSCLDNGIRLLEEIEEDVDELQLLTKDAETYQVFEEVASAISGLVTKRKAALFHKLSQVEYEGSSSEKKKFDKLKASLHHSLSSMPAPKPLDLNSSKARCKKCEPESTAATMGKRRHRAPQQNQNLRWEEALFDQDDQDVEMASTALPRFSYGASSKLWNNTPQTTSGQAQISSTEPRNRPDHSEQAGNAKRFWESRGKREKILGIVSVLEPAKVELKLHTGGDAFAETPRTSHRDRHTSTPTTMPKTKTQGPVPKLFFGNLAGNAGEDMTSDSSRLSRLSTRRDHAQQQTPRTPKTPKSARKSARGAMTPRTPTYSANLNQNLSSGPAKKEPTPRTVVPKLVFGDLSGVAREDMSSDSSRLSRLSTNRALPPSMAGVDNATETPRGATVQSSLVLSVGENDVESGVCSGFSAGWKNLVPASTSAPNAWKGAASRRLGVCPEDASTASGCQTPVSWSQLGLRQVSCISESPSRLGSRQVSGISTGEDTANLNISTVEDTENLLLPVRMADARIADGSFWRVGGVH